MRTLKDSYFRYRRLFDASQDGVLILDAKTGVITDVNPFLVNLLGYSREEFVEKKIWQVDAFRDIEAGQDAFEALQGHETIRYEDLPLRAKNGNLIQVELVRNVYLVGDEKVIQCNIRDITERKQAQDALLQSEVLLRQLPIWDYLTGLVNRHYMEETLERELLRATRKQLSLGIIKLNVDDFKRFNDTHGRAAGDEVLRKLGDFLLKHVRREDITCRYSGDEFVIVLPDVSRKVTWERAEHICEHFKQFHLQFQEQAFGAFTFSIGVAVFPDDGSTSATILRSVDEALYRAKREGRSRVAVKN